MFFLSTIFVDGGYCVFVPLFSLMGTSLSLSLSEGARCAAADAALARHGGNIARTARALGLHRQSLQKLLARRDLRNGEISREI